MKQALRVGLGVGSRAGGRAFSWDHCHGAVPFTGCFGFGRSPRTTLILLAAGTCYQAAHKAVAILSDLHTPFVYRDSYGGQEAGSRGSGLLPQLLPPLHLNRQPVPDVNPAPTSPRRKQLLCLSFHFSLSLSFFLKPRIVGTTHSVPTILKDAHCIDSKVVF